MPDAVERPRVREFRHRVYLRYRRSALLTHSKVQDLRLVHGDRRLREGTDYSADHDQGTVFPLVDTPPFEAVATFRALGTRYDALCLDPKTQSTHLVHGPERGFDVIDHMPSTPTDQIKVASIHVGEDSEVIRMKQPDLSWVEECRARMPNLARLMRDRDSVRLMGYGTSLTAQGGPAPDEFFIPNGVTRDCLKFYYAPSRLAPDTIERIRPVDGHIHIGFNWALKAAIERRSPTTYLNMGISGSTSDDGETRNGFPNGNNAKRLAAARELKPDVIVIEYCINDLDSPDHKMNLVRMIEALRSPTTDIVVLGCTGFPSFRSVEHWASGEAAARLAADETGAAFVPLSPLVAPGNEGTTGVARRTFCSANGINHPGPAEFDIYGRWLARIVP
jgi:hypothetical protein